MPLKGSFSSLACCTNDAFSSGIHATVELRKAGFSTRIHIDDWFQRYGCLMKNSKDIGAYLRSVRPPFPPRQPLGDILLPSQQS